MYYSNLSMEEAVKNGEVVTVWSGGLDSTGMIFLLLHRFKCKVHPIFVQRNQTNLKQEEKAVKHYSELFSKKYNKLFSKPIKVKVPIPADEFRTFTKDAKYALRNSDIINQGIRFSIQLGLNIVLIATFKSEDRFSDGSPSFLKCKTREARIGTNRQDFLIISPFFYGSSFPTEKSKLIKICHDLGFDLSRTRSCYKENPQHCGLPSCSACSGRKSAYRKANVEDSTTYQNAGR